MRDGTLVSIEGIDGAGKTTVIEGAQETDGLEDRFPDAVYTTEPKNETWLGQVVREAISNEGRDVPPPSIFFLFLAEHANHVEKYVRPALQNGQTVVCDRYVDSRYAYQSRAMESLVEDDALEWIRSVQEQKWTEMPDVTILLDVSLETAMSRLDGDEIFEEIEKLEHFQDVYRQLAEESERYVVVDAERSPEQVIAECQEIIEDAQS